MVYACSTHHQTGDIDSFQLVIPLTVQLDSQGTFVPCEARIVWYSAGRTSSRQLRDTTDDFVLQKITCFTRPGGIVFLTIPEYIPIACTWKRKAARALKPLLFGP